LNAVVPVEEKEGLRVPLGCHLFFVIGIEGHVLQFPIVVGAPLLHDDVPDEIKVNARRHEAPELAFVVQLAQAGQEKRTQHGDRGILLTLPGLLLSLLGIILLLLLGLYHKT